MFYKVCLFLVAFSALHIVNVANPTIDNTAGPIPSWMVCPNASAVYWASGIAGNVAMTNMDTGEIFLDYSAFHKFSIDGQKFVFFHECGHVNGTYNEILADDYAYKKAKEQGWLSAKLITEVCKSLGSQDGRCDELKSKFKKDHE